MLRARHRRARGCGTALALLVACAGTSQAQQVLFSQSTDPPGLFSSSIYTSSASSVQTTNAPLAQSGYSFTHWSVNGVRQGDPFGRALNPVRFSIYQDSYAVAHYVDTVTDANQDGVPDWFGLLYFGFATNDAALDADGDGGSTLAEFHAGTDPLIQDRAVPGGISRRRADPMILLLAANHSIYSERSDPPGLVYQQYAVPNGSIVTTAIFYGESNGLVFTHWSVNDVRLTDALGMALARASLVITGETVATAHFIATGSDEGTNGVPDWWELFALGNTTNAAASDADGDGVSLLDEYRRDTNPMIHDRCAAGGLSRRRSSRVTINTAGWCRYDIHGDPPGLITPETGVVSNGALVATASLYGDVNGYSFAYWSIDDVRQEDATGRALGRAVVTTTGDVTLVAHYLATAGDADQDGLPDWWEISNFGSLDQDALADADGDGRGLRAEFNQELSPLTLNRVADGGLSRRRAPLVTMNMQAYPQIAYVMRDARVTNFFGYHSHTNGAFTVNNGSAPALGDWNGDGIPDLFVGGAGGVLRVFENAGSPVVPNLVERTSNFAGLASAWTGVGRPAPALGDWSGDGRDDLAIGGRPGEIILIRSGGSFQSPGPAAPTGVLTLASSHRMPALADATGDGRADLFVLLDDGSVDLYANTGNPAVPFSMAARQSNILGLAVSGATGMTAADVDENGTVDVLLSDATGQIWDFLRGSNGVYALKSRVFAGSYAGFADQLTVAAGDLDGDGDSDLICGFAEGGLIYLRNPSPRLLVNPPTATMLTGQQATFSSLNSTSPINWSILRSVSGGSIGAGSGLYTAGVTGQSMDRIEGVDQTGLRGLAYVNVIDTNEVASFGKAVVIAGGRSLDDPVWLASDYLAGRAYNVLRYKGYSKENIRYLSLQPGRDVDGNGLADDIYGLSSMANAGATFTNWVGHANRLFVYLVDHGSSDENQSYFRLNTGENVSATQLNDWLTALQNQYGTEVLLLMDFCYAGNFLPALAYPGPAKRIVIAATAQDELTYFLAGGLVSFSDLFLSGLLEGMNPLQAFSQAQDGMGSYQHATLDDNGSGTFQPGADGAAAAQFQVGASQLAGKDVPVIGAVAESQTLTTGTRATLWAGEIQSYYPLADVRCSILPPSSTLATNSGIPVTTVPELLLDYDPASQTYTAAFDGFTEQGVYKVNYYARDLWGSVSPPRQGFVSQAGYDERLIVVAGDSTNDPQRDSVLNMAATAYRTALARRLPPGRIRYLAPVTNLDLNADGTNDVAGLPTLGNLGSALATWAAGARKVTLYLVGGELTNAFQLNAAETLAATGLAAMVNGFQTSNQAVNVIMDFDGAGACVAALAGASNQERIVVAGTRENISAMRAHGGLVSFSQYFWNGIFNGQSVGGAFSVAQGAIQNVSGRLHQSAQLDDNRNGVANEKNKDGRLAAARYIGTAFVTGDDTPYIGETMSGGFLAGVTQSLVWAAQILDVTGIDHVWCFITPPDYDGTAELPQVGLTWSALSSRYEAVVTNFAQPGAFTLTFQALNHAGVFSAPAQAVLLVGDLFEADDTAAQARAFDPGAVQAHNFHASNDEDWVVFYAPTGVSFEISATQLSTNSDVMLEVFHRYPDGTMSNLDGLVRDVYGLGPGKQEVATLDLLADTNLQPGLYLVRVSNADGDGWGWGADSEYNLAITMPVGAGVLTVVAADKLHIGAAPPGAVAYVDGGNAKAFNGAQTVVYQGLSAGYHDVQVTVPAGYVAEEDPAAAGQVQNPASVLYGNPKLKDVVDLSWQTVVFQFVPLVTATGTVRDMITGEFLQGVSLRWLATEGVLAGLIHTQYPNASPYGTAWQTRPDGGFPADLKLPAVSMDLLMSKAGYSNVTAVGALIHPPAGHRAQFGDLLMWPVDANGNGIADAWEMRHFGALTGATNDPDGDGQSNRGEYWGGTDPTNAASVFRASEVMSTNGQITIRWPVTPGRVYRLGAADDLGAAVWTVVAGPWTAGVGQTTMAWTDTSPVATNRDYLIQTVLP